MSPVEERRLNELETKIKRKPLKIRENIGPFMTDFAKAYIVTVADDDGCILVYSGTDDEWEEYENLRDKKLHERMNNDINNHMRALLKSCFDGNIITAYSEKPVGLKEGKALKVREY